MFVYVQIAMKSDVGRDGKCRVQYNLTSQPWRAQYNTLCTHECVLFYYISHISIVIIGIKAYRNILGNHDRR